jgi:hypothetical protein
MSERPFEMLQQLRPVLPLPRSLDDQALQLLEMALLLGPRDVRLIVSVIEQAKTICESDGEDTALAVLDQLRALMTDRLPDA